MTLIVRLCIFLFRLALVVDFADLSLPCFLPAHPFVATCSSSVVSSCPASSVAASVLSHSASASSSVLPVSAPPCRMTTCMSGSIAAPSVRSGSVPNCSVSSFPPSPRSIAALPVWPCPVPSRSGGSFAQPSVASRVPVGPFAASSFCRPAICFPFFPVVCLVLVVPVLLSTPFGFP